MRALTMILLVMLLPAAGFCQGAGEISVTAAVDKQTVYIGDLIAYSVTITYDSTLRLTPPAVGANLGGFDVKEYHVGGEEKLDGGRHRQVMQFSIRTFTTGDYVIPPLPIEYMKPDSTYKYITADPIKITVKSVLAEGAAADTLKLKPLKGQVSMSKSHKTTIIILTLLAVVAAAGVIFYLRRRRPVSEAVVDPRPAWEIACEELAVLREKDLPAKGEVKLFYGELTDIFRRYLQKKFDFPAIDMTTEEIGVHLETTPLVDNIREEITAFLTHADLVKFAKYIPAAERPMQDWETAYALVDKTKDLVVVPPVAPEEPATVLEPVAAGGSGTADGLDYAPPELREYLADKNRGEKE